MISFVEIQGRRIRKSKPFQARQEVRVKCRSADLGCLQSLEVALEELWMFPRETELLWTLCHGQLLPLY